MSDKGDAEFWAKNRMGGSVSGSRWVQHIVSSVVQNLSSQSHFGYAQIKSGDVLCKYTMI